MLRLVFFMPILRCAKICWKYIQKFFNVTPKLGSDFFDLLDNWMDCIKTW
jgi:hypothetical protein